MLYTHSFFIFNGKKTSDYDILVERQPDIISPALPMDAVTVPGRSGALHMAGGAYDSYIKSAECAVMSGRYLDEIIQWLKGAGDVIFSNEPDRRYEAVVYNQIPFSQVMGLRFRRFMVPFEVQPYKYAVSETPIILTAPGSVLNHGSVAAQPVITVYGAGDMTLTINGREAALYGIGDYVTIDGRMLCAYRDGTLANQQMSGAFPYFDTGVNDIGWTGSVQRVEILPYWRWI